MTLGEVWDADQLMGKTAYPGITLNSNSKDPKTGEIKPQYWGLPGYLSPSDYNCFGKFTARTNECQTYLKKRKEDRWLIHA